MDKTEEKRMSTKKKLVTSIIAVPTALVLYLLTMTYIVSPIQDGYDKLRFDELNTQMTKMYNEVLATAGDEEEWKYDTDCRYASEDAISIGEGYNCTMKISTIVLRTDIADTDNLHKKYYPIVSSATFITPREALLIDTYRDTGSRTLIKDAYIRYSSTIDETVDCSYFINADKLSNTLDYYNLLAQDKSLNEDSEISTVYFKCEIHSNQDWYNKIR